ncbi:serine hydrolase [Bifidobacterium parmae]|uniref:Beta-lactamase n=1 Tax=Bifidobacterium parmae TaxID=361854 RepID=A0A2N5IZU2_9BIFI|nr:serine hydrolase [Bifidobacterium parmae]PLS27475.1 beta-lactamase [Bifidobacterium parmae]
MTGKRYGRHGNRAAAHRGRSAAARVVAVVAATALIVAGAGVAVSARMGWLPWGASAAGGVPHAAVSTDVAPTDGAAAGASHGALSRASAPSPSARIARQRDMDALGESIRGRIAGYQGTWQVYVEDLASGATTSIDTHAGYAASVIKLYVMLAVFQRIADGALAEDSSIDQLLTQMITVSSNEATNSLISTLGGGDMDAGFAQVNEIAARYGFKDSHIDQALGVIDGDPNRKTTTADDAGRFMAAVYRGGLVSKDASRRMLDLLLGQTRRTKIPGGVPSGVTVANKTGEIDGVENDAAIVFAGSDTSAGMDGTATQGDYVLVVMTSDVSSAAAQASIRDLSALVWQTLQ